MFPLSIIDLKSILLVWVSILFENVGKVWSVVSVRGCSIACMPTHSGGSSNVLVLG